MKIQTIIIPLCLSLLFFACAGEADKPTEPVEKELNKDSLANVINTLEEQVMSNGGVPDKTLFSKAINEFQNYALLFPEDPISPEYLLKASDFSHSIQKHEKSVKILDRIIAEYPDFDRIESVKFVRASHIDFELRDTTRAKEAYTAFIAEYPNSELVGNAQSRIDNISLDAEALIEKFMKEQKNTSAQ